MAVKLMCSLCVVESNKANYNVLGSCSSWEHKMGKVASKLEGHLEEVEVRIHIRDRSGNTRKKSAPWRGGRQK